MDDLRHWKHKNKTLKLQRYNILCSIIPMSQVKANTCTCTENLLMVDWTGWTSWASRAPPNCPIVVIDSLLVNDFLCMYLKPLPLKSEKEDSHTNQKTAYHNSTASLASNRCQRIAQATSPLLPSKTSASAYEVFYEYSTPRPKINK
jgi:hypothetical protein